MESDPFFPMDFHVTVNSFGFSSRDAQSWEYKFEEVKQALFRLEGIAKSRNAWMEGVSNTK